MKKLLFFSLIFFSGCTCLMSHVPPQYLQIEDSCAAVLPNYLPLVKISDNCTLASVLQTPAEGFILNSTLPLTVTIKATDTSGNFREVQFTVTLIDTIKPTIEYVGPLVQVNYQIIDDLYDKADLALLQMMQTFKEDSLYYVQNLQVTTAPARAINGGYRVWQFLPKDSI